MLRSTVARIKEYENIVKGKIINRVSMVGNSGYDPVCLIMSVSEIRSNPKLSLDIREYSCPYQASVIIEYVESHSLSEILVFLETIVNTGNIEVRNLRIKALAPIVRVVNEILNID